MMMTTFPLKIRDTYNYFTLCSKKAPAANLVRGLSEVDLPVFFKGNQITINIGC